MRAAQVPEAVDFDVTYRVERSAGSAGAVAGDDGLVDGGQRASGEVARLLRPTALTAPDARLRAVAAGIAAV